jgi:hypothetical protein
VIFSKFSLSLLPHIGQVRDMGSSPAFGNHRTFSVFLLTLSFSFKLRISTADSIAAPELRCDISF